RVSLRREVVSLRIIVERAQLRVVIEMPPRELARRNPAGNRVQPAKRALERRMAALEDRAVYDLVQEHGEIEDGEPLHERKRNPGDRIGERDKTPRGQRENQELTSGNCEMPRRALPVKGREQVARQRAGELGPEAGCVLAVKVALHGTSAIVPANRT